MRVFEVNFGPKNKQDSFCESFAYEPENIFEKRLGSLYIAGELKKPMPQNANFLNHLSLVLKREYYSSGLKKTVEASFQDALKKANEFLEETARRGDITWLGNLGFVVFSFQDFILTFAKVGDIKIMLQRNGELVDIGQNLEFQDIEPYPLKVFSNIAAGKLAQNDQIIILTKEIFTALSQNNDLVNRLSVISKEEELKEFLKTNRQVLGEASGLCLLLTVNEDLKFNESINFQQEGPKFSLLAVLAPIIKKIKLPSPPSFPLFLKFPPSQTWLPHYPAIFRKAALLIFLTAILTLSFLVFNGEREAELAQARQKLAAAQAKITTAESLLIIKQEEKAKTLFKEAWDILLPLAKNTSSFKSEARVLQKSIEGYIDLRNP